VKPTAGRAGESEAPEVMRHLREDGGRVAVAPAGARSQVVSEGVLDVGEDGGELLSPASASDKGLILRLRWHVGIAKTTMGQALSGELVPSRPNGTQRNIDSA